MLMKEMIMFQIKLQFSVEEKNKREKESFSKGDDLYFVIL